MSLRQQAKILGISPTYLSLMINGKRKWQPEIKARYEQLVNSLPRSVYKKKQNSRRAGGWYGEPFRFES